MLDSTGYGCWPGGCRSPAVKWSRSVGRGGILHIEHEDGLPSERDLLNLIVDHRLVAGVCDLYYATTHFTILFVFLLWLFLRHRDHYRPLRRVLALTALYCLLVQLLPVAPPRMMPGFTDVAAKFGQSVYAGGLAADQLSAMPSVHIAWAVLVGWGVVRVSPSRWLALLHPILTTFVVLATANHYWADGLVAVALLIVGAGTERAARRLLTYTIVPRLERSRTSAAVSVEQQPFARR